MSGQTAGGIYGSLHLHLVMGVQSMVDAGREGGEEREERGERGEREEREEQW